MASRMVRRYTGTVGVHITRARDGKYDALLRSTVAEVSIFSSIRGIELPPHVVARLGGDPSRSYDAVACEAVHRAGKLDPAFAFAVEYDGTGEILVRRQEQHTACMTTTHDGSK